MLTGVSRIAVADVTKREERRTETTQAPNKVEALDATLVAENRHGNGEKPKQRRKIYTNPATLFEPEHDVDKLV